MTTDEIRQRNRIISYWDGWKFIPKSDNGLIPEHYERGHDWMNGIDDFKYHTDWNTIQAIVAQIEENEMMATMTYVNQWDNRGHYIFSVYRELDENRSRRNVFIEIATSSKIESTWLGVCEFIRLSNSNIIPRTQEDFDKHYQTYRHLIDQLQYPENK